MTNAIQVFSYEDAQVRTYTDEIGEVWLVAKVVSKILGLQNIQHNMNDLEDDEKGVCNVYAPGGMQTMTIINEPGLYKLTFRSRKPNAKTFTRWVTHEVLPSIRKTGSYIAPQAEPQEPLNIRVRIAGILQKLAQQVSDESLKEYLIRKSYRYATGSTLPERKEKPSYWTAEQLGQELKWTADAVLRRAERLDLMKKAKNGHWDGGVWYFSKEGRDKFLNLVRCGVIKIEDGYECFENGTKRIHWDFDADAARF